VVLETVGLGQSEVHVDDVVDVVALILPPAGGDELQGVKKGIVEVADIVGVNKCDGDMVNQGKRTVSEYRQALHFCRPKQPGWTTPVLPISAAKGDGLEKLWSKVTECHELLLEKGELWDRRRRQAELAMWDELKAQIMSLVEKDPELRRLAHKQARSLVSSIIPKQSKYFTYEDFETKGNRKLSLSDTYKLTSSPSSNQKQPNHNRLEYDDVNEDEDDDLATTPRAAASKLMKAIAGRLLTNQNPSLNDSLKK